MYYVYDGGEFRYSNRVSGMVKIDHSLLKVYKPEVRVDEVEHLGITEHMVLSYLYNNKENFNDIPLAYPLKVGLIKESGFIIIKDVQGWTVARTFANRILPTELVNMVMIRLPIKMEILDAYKSGEYQYLLDMDIPQVSDMIYRLIDLNEDFVKINTNSDDDLENVVDSVDIIGSIVKKL